MLWITSPSYWSFFLQNCLNKLQVRYWWKWWLLLCFFLHFYLFTCCLILPIYYNFNFLKIIRSAALSDSFSMRVPSLYGTRVAVRPGLSNAASKVANPINGRWPWWLPWCPWQHLLLEKLSSTTTPPTSPSAWGFLWQKDDIVLILALKTKFICFCQ